MSDTESIINWAELSDDDLRTELTAGMKELDARKDRAKAKKKISELSDSELSEAFDRAIKKGNDR